MRHYSDTKCMLPNNSMTDSVYEANHGIEFVANHEMILIYQTCELRDSSIYLHRCKSTCTKINQDLDHVGLSIHKITQNKQQRIENLHTFWLLY